MPKYKSWNCQTLGENAVTKTLNEFWLCVWNVCLGVGLMGLVAFSENREFLEGCFAGSLFLMGGINVYRVLQWRKEKQS